MPPPPSARPRVTVVIPNWNGREMLDMVLPTLGAQSYDALRVLVVDNGSTDGSVEHLRDRHPGVDVLALRENTGFAGAVNAGFDAAETEYVALFNNDMELEPDCVAELVAALDAHPEAGSATAKMVMLREPGVLDGAGDSLTWFGGAWRRGHGEPDDGRFDTPQEVFSACGGAALSRAAALDRVGLMDARFFAYLEDVDWGLRAQLAGLTCRYVPGAVVRHLGGATSRRMGDLEAYLIHRNTLWLVAKGFPLARLVPALPAVLAFQLWTLLRTARSGGPWRAILRGWRHGLRGLPVALRARRGVQARRTAPLAQLDRALGWRPRA